MKPSPELSEHMLAVLDAGHVAAGTTLPESQKEQLEFFYGALSEHEYKQKFDAPAINVDAKPKNTETKHLLHLGLGIFLWGCLFMTGMKLVETFWPWPTADIYCLELSEVDTHCEKYEAKGQ